LCRVRLCYDGPVASGCRNDGSRYTGGRRRPLRLVGGASALRSARAHWGASDRFVIAGPSRARRRLRSCASATGRAGTPLWRFCPLQRMRPGRAVHAAMHQTIPLRRCLRSPEACMVRASGNATRPCGFPQADHAAPGSFVAPYRYPPVLPSFAPVVGASLMGLHPSQCYSCPQAARCFHRDSPTCRFASVHPGRRVYIAGRSTAYCDVAPT
jgi:hypothetical protein